MSSTRRRDDGLQPQLQVQQEGAKHGIRHSFTSSFFSLGEPAVRFVDVGSEALALQIEDSLASHEPVISAVHPAFDEDASGLGMPSPSPQPQQS